MVSTEAEQLRLRYNTQKNEYDKYRESIPIQTHTLPVQAEQAQKKWRIKRADINSRSVDLLTPRRPTS